MAKKRFGIDALFASTIIPEADATNVRRLALDELAAAPNQPRRRLDAQALAPLVDSIKQSGILQPIIVREWPRTAKTEARSRTPRYQIVAGERRYQAARLAGLTDIPVIVRSLSDEEALAVALVENLQREDLNPVEETEGYLALLQLKLRNEPDFAVFARANDRDPYGDVLRLLFAMNNDRTARVKEIAEGLHNEKSHEHVVGERASRTRVNNNVVIKLTPMVEATFTAIGRTSWLSFIQHRLPLRRLPADILEALRAGKLEYTKARLLGRLTSEALGEEERRANALRARLLARAIDEDLSLGELRRLVASELAELKQQKTTEPAKSPEPLSLQELTRQTASQLRQLRPATLPVQFQRQLQEKLDELNQLVALALNHNQPESK